MDQQKRQFKGISSTDLYNLMNDQRHLAIIDLRVKEEFENMQIRTSASIFQEANHLSQYINLQDHNATKNEEKYKIKSIRRLVLVHKDPNEIISKQEECLQMISEIGIKDYKIMYLKECLDIFIKKYSFLCLNKEVLLNYEQKHNTITEQQEQVLFAHCQFPHELIENQVFLGSVLNSNSRRQMNGLKIKSIIDFKDYEEDKQAKPWKKEEYNYENIPISLTIDSIVDFDYINELIDKSAKPVLLVCQNGNLVVNCIGIGYLMWKLRLNYNIATLKVFQLRGNSEVHKKVFGQLLTYIPEIKQNQQ